MTLHALRCPKCRRDDRISLTEVHEEIGTTDYGVVEITEGGALTPPGEWFFEVGYSIAVTAECGRCGHGWKPRRQGISA